MIASEKLNLFGKIRSYFYPVRIEKSSDAGNRALELFYFRGRYQLSTDDALYSDGKKYKPLLIAFKNPSMLQNIQNVLVLGAGTGSAASILHSKGLMPTITFVEIDRTIYNWGKQIFANTKNIYYILADANSYIYGEQDTYDIIVADIFLGRIPQPFVSHMPFLSQCKSKLKEGGFFVLNYIVYDKREWDMLQQNMKMVFGSRYSVKKHGVNRILVATA